MDFKRLLWLSILYSLVFIIVNFYFIPKKNNDNKISEGEILTLKEKESVVEPVNRSLNINGNIFISDEDLINIKIENTNILFSKNTACPVYYEYCHPITKNNIKVFDFVNKNINNNFIPPLFLILPYNSPLIYSLKSIDKNENGSIKALFLYEDEQVNVIKEYLIEKESPLINVKINIKYKKQDVSEKIKIFIPDVSVLKEEIGKGAFVYNDEKKSLTKVENKDCEKVVSAKPKFIGTQGDYFVQSVFQKDQFLRTFFRCNENNKVDLFLESNPFNSDLEISFKWYCGPKDYSSLKKIDSRLAEIMDYGWFSQLSILILNIIKYIASIIGNFGFAIILFAIFVRLLFLPLSYFSKDGAKKKDEFTKKYNYVRTKYKDDPERRSAEEAALYKEYGVMPMGLGCLPLLLQIPILIALQKCLRNTILLYNVPFVGWITDISLPDHFKILPAIFVILTYFQASKNLEPVKKFAFLVFSLIFFFIVSSWPVGILLFMITSMIMAFIQTSIFGF
jgi:YidC/Oxa1 family membrane protein insertase